MALDPSLPLQIQQPNPAAFISSFVDLGKKKLELDKARETYTTDVEASKARSASDVARSKVDTANVQPLIEQQVAQTQGAQAVASGQQLATMRQHILNAKQQTSELLTMPDSALTPDVIKASLVSSLKNSGASDAAVSQAVSQIPPVGSSPADLRKFILRGLIQASDAESQLNRQYPNPMMVNTGQEIKPVASGNPATTGVTPGASIGMPTQMQPPPTTQVFNSQTNQPELYGARPGGPGAGPTSTAPALGVPEGVSGMVGPNVKHFEGVVANAGAAPMRIGVLQNIKELAPQAMTGDAPTLKKLVSKLAGYTGWTGSEQTPTDVMAKESALLASNAGNTDLARLLNEAATPNGHMTKDAILKTADQLIGVEKKNQAAQQFFAGTPPNSPQYTDKLKAWNQFADPRVFEYAAKSPAERKSMLAGMSDADKANMKRNMQQLHMMGVGE